MAKKVSLEEVRNENLKKVIKDIESITDTYQRTHLRILLIQAINGMSAGPVSLPEGREALDNSKTKTNNTTTASVEALETVANVKEALSGIVAQPEESIADPEIAPTEATGIEAEKELAVPEETAEDAVIGIGAQVETLEFDPGDGNLVEIAPQYNALINVPDDENKQILAYYLAVYDEESIAAITNAFSSNIEADPYALLNDNNYMAYLDYFNECLQQ